MMKSSIYGSLVLALSFAVAAPLASAGDVSVGLTITGEITPGVYGRVDLANRPPPQVVYAKPVLIERPPPHVVVEQPIYLHVPPGHAKNWSKHCREYHACNRPVYFVKSAEYEPGYHREDHDDHGHGHGHDKH
jgi:hypothetical protein